jgi:hypothetical protein
LTVAVPAEPVYPVGWVSKLLDRAGRSDELLGGRTGADLRDRQVQHHRGHRNGIVLAACQQSRVFGQLSGIDLAGGDTAQNVVGPSEVFALAVLATGKFDACPDAVDGWDVLVGWGTECCRG